MHQLVLARAFGGTFGRFVAGLCAIALGLGLGLTPSSATPASAAVVTGTDANGLVFEVDDDNAAAGAVVTGYTGSSKDVVIPTVVEIGGVAYDVTSIGDKAFEDRGLDTLSFDTPSMVTTIGDEAFFNNNLRALIIPPSVVSIEYCAFYSNALATVTFAEPSSLATISHCAFEVNQLTAVTIPSSVVTIGSSAFARNDFATISFQAPSSLTTIGASAFFESYTQTSARNSLAELEIPGSVVSIGNRAFYEVGLQQLTFAKPSNLASIGEYAFTNNRFSAVELPSSLTSVGKYAFADGDLESVSFDLPSSLGATSVGMFSTNPITDLTIPDSVTTIGAASFENTDLSEIDLPDSLTTIEPSAFLSANLTSVTIPESVTSIGRTAFNRNPELRDVYFTGDRPFFVDSDRPLGLEGIAVAHFPCGAEGFGHPVWLHSYETSTTCEITFDANGGVGSMESTLVETGERLPLSTFTRDDFRFVGWRTSADGTEPLVADEQVSAFLRETGLFAQWVPATAPECITYDVTGGTAIVTTYDSACGGADVILPATTLVDGVSYRVTGIGTGAFEGSGISSLELSNGITSIGERAFFGNALVDVSIPASVAVIGDQAFDDNPDLDRVSFPGGAPVDTGTTDAGRPLGPDSVTVHFRAGASGFTHPTWRGYSTKALHTLRFDANWAAGAVFPVSLTTGETLPPEAYLRYEWRFAGWNTEPDGSGVSVADEGASPFAADTLLYAQWVPDTEPPVVSDPFISGGPVIACVPDSEPPPIIASGTPIFSVVVTDPEGSSTDTVFTLTSADGTVLWVSHPDIAGSGNRALVKVPTGILRQEGLYRWRAQATDNRGITSEYSPWCEFQLDIYKPPPPTVTSIAEGAMAVYPPQGNSGGVGRTGVFELDAGESSDAVRFNYSFNSTSMLNTIEVGPDGTARVSYTPTSDFPVTLYVRAVDVAGNLSDRVSYTFDVGTLRTVWFSANRGIGSMASVTESTPTVLPLSTFTRPGYQFVGWNTKADGTGLAVADGSVWPFSSAATMYAQWQRNDIASIDIVGLDAALANSTGTYTVTGWDESGVTLGNVTNEVTLSGANMTIAGGRVTFDYDPWVKPGTVDTRTLVAMVDADPVITDSLAIEVTAPPRDVSLLPYQIYGNDRFPTPAVIATVWDRYFDASIAFVVASDGSPESMAAAAAAAHLNAPLIVMPPNALFFGARARLESLQPDRIIVVGSPSSIPETVVASMRLVSSSPDVIRLAGATRYDTARMVVQYAFDVNGNGDGAEDRDIHTLVVTTGRNRVDAIVAAPVSDTVGGAVIVVDGAASSIPAATIRLIRDLSPQRIIIAGASNAVSTKIETQLRSGFGTKTVKRIGSADRYATALALTDYFYDDAEILFWVAATNHPDALAGAVLAAELDAPMILMPRECISAATTRFVERLAAPRSAYLGTQSTFVSGMVRPQSC